MAGTSFVRKSASALACLVALALGTTGAAHAQLSKVDQKCRNAVAKSFAKAIGSANKVSTGCHKNRNLDKVPNITDCNDLSVGQADSKQKFQKARAKLEGSIAKSCTDQGASAGLLENYLSCPEPCGTETGVSNPLASFAELGDCLACLAGDVIERRNTVMLGMPTAPIADKDTRGCHKAIAKGYGKHLKTLLKDRQGCQKDQDKLGNNELQPCDGLDPKGKIGAAATDAAASVADACAGVNLADLDSCSSVDATSLNACLLAEDDARGAEAFAAGYELDPTICPIALTVTSHAGTGIGGASMTRLEAGWNGIGHGQDLVDLYSYGVALSCPNAEPPCGTCTIDGFTDTGVLSGAFTRCREDTRIECSNPFGMDGACPGAQECAFYLGPPLPLSASNTPVCVVIRSEQDASGTTIIETGDTSLDLRLRAVVYSGLSLTQPCPLCVGDTTPQDGNRDGTCQGGLNNNADCDVQGFDATFGNTSMDCVPSLAQNFSGQGLIIDSSFGTGTSTMPFGTNCDFPLGALTCACAVCSADTTVPCNANADCSGIGAGTCTSNGGGESRRPNACSDLTCTDIGSERGECADGPDVTYCDLQLRANGKGYVACDTNADCDAVDSACAKHCSDDLSACETNADCSSGTCNPECGACTLVEPRSCFLDPIVGEGTADPEAPVVAGTFCTPPTTSTGINAATGLPGPSRAEVQLEVERVY